MGMSTDILPMPEALPGLGVHGVVFHNGNGYYYTCKEYCSSIEKRTYECVKPDCKGTANIGSLGSSMVEICRHNHAPDYSYRKKCIVFHLILQRFIEEQGSPIDILQDILTSLAETLDTNADSNLQEDTVGNPTNVVKSNPVIPTLSDRSRKSRRHSLRRSSSSGRLTEETQSQSSEIPETPADCVPTENDFHSSEDGLEAQDEDSLKDDGEFDKDQEYTPSSKRKKCKEYAANQQKESVSIPILVKDEIEIVDTIATNVVETSTSRNQAKEMPALLSVLGLEQLVGHQRQKKMVKRNRNTWSREEEIRRAIAEGRNYFGPVEFCLSPKEKVNIDLDGYSYRYKRERPNGSSRWECTMKRCKSVLELQADMGFTIVREHLCQRKDINNIEVKRAKCIIKKRVAEETTRIGIIYKEEMAKLIQRGIKVPRGGASANISSCYDYRKKLIAAGEYRPMDGINIDDYLEQDQDYEMSSVAAGNTAESDSTGGHQ